MPKHVQPLLPFGIKTSMGGVHIVNESCWFQNQVQNWMYIKAEGEEEEWLGLGVVNLNSVTLTSIHGVITCQAVIAAHTNFYTHTLHLYKLMVHSLL